MIQLILLLWYFITPFSIQGKAWSIIAKTKPVVQSIVLILYIKQPRGVGPRMETYL